MPVTPRAVILALLCLLLASADGAPRTAPPAPPPTIEPTLPLLVDMRLSGVERAAGRVRAQLEIDLRAHGRIDAIELSLALPREVGAATDTALPSSLADGERRRVAIPVEAPGDRDLPIRLHAAFRTADGRVFRLGQGVTLEAPRPGMGGRRRLGAWEVPAVPIEELRR